MLVAILKQNKHNNLVHKIRHWWCTLDKWLFLLVTAFLLFGLLTVLSASPAASGRIDASPFLFAKKQVFSIVAGFMAMVFFSAIKKRYIFILSIMGGLCCLALMVYLVLFGHQIKGASRWINLFGITIQPSDFLKPFFVTINGTILRRLKYNTLKRLTFSLTLLAIIAVLLFLQPDFGMLLIYLITWFMQIFIAGASWRFVILTGAGLTTVPVIAYFCLSHVKHRIRAFLGIDKISYQTKKALACMKNGGWLGRGIGGGEIKYELPDSHSDYIFTVIGEEWGGLICLSIVCGYFFIIMRATLMFNKTNNSEYRIIGFGFIAVIFAHVFIAISVNLNVMPSKGTTLPFISYGGSSIISMCIIIGLMLNFAKNTSTYQSMFELYKKKLLKNPF